MKNPCTYDSDLHALFSRILKDGESLYPKGELPRNPAVLVHSAMSAFGHIDGGASKIIHALMLCSEKNRITVVMPAHSDSTPDDCIFDPRISTCRKMGQISETFRTMKKVRRSRHPQLSFCAKGPSAYQITRGHSCEKGLGIGSPLDTLYKMNALILMLGTGYETCTALHLAEYTRNRVLEEEGKSPDVVTCHAAFYRFFRLYFKTWEDVAFHPELFAAIGDRFESIHPDRIIRGKLEHGREYAIYTLRDIVNFSIDSYKVLQ